MGKPLELLVQVRILGGLLQAGQVLTVLAPLLLLEIGTASGTKRPMLGPVRLPADGTPREPVERQLT